MSRRLKTVQLPYNKLEVIEKMAFLKLVFLLVSTFAIARSAVSKNAELEKLSGIIETTLESANGAFKDEKFTSIHIPDYAKRFGMAPLVGLLNATNGYFRNPATISLGERESVNVVANGYIMRHKFSLSEIQSGYDFHLVVTGTHEVGKMHISFGKHSFSMETKTFLGPKCSFEISQLELEQLEGVEVSIEHISGIKEMAVLDDGLKTMILQNFQPKVTKIVSQVFLEKLNKHFQDQDVCKHFHE